MEQLSFFPEAGQSKGLLATKKSILSQHSEIAQFASGRCAVLILTKKNHSESIWSVLNTALSC
jgi:hypothetical protein